MNLQIWTPVLRSARLRHHEQGRESSSSRSKQLKFPPKKKVFHLMEEELKLLIIWLCQTRPKSAVKLLVFTGGQSRKGFDGKNLFRILGTGIWTPAYLKCRMRCIQRDLLESKLILQSPENSNLVTWLQSPFLKAALQQPCVFLAICSLKIAN